MNALLPNNGTRLERALEQTTARDLAPDAAAIGTLWDADRCPAKLLPWLAWALSVEDWRADWPEALQRQVIAASIAIHRKKGTRWAVEQALAALNLRAELTEWWQAAPPGAPHTFDLIAWANDNLAGGGAILSPELYALLAHRIDGAKPVRAHYSFRVGARYSDGLAIACAARAGALMRRGAVPQAVQPSPAATALQAGSAIQPRACRRSFAAARAAQPRPLSAAPRVTCAARALTVIHVSMEARR